MIPMSSPVLPGVHRKVPSKNLTFRHQVSCHTHSTTLSLGAVCRPDLDPFCHLVSNLALTPRPKAALTLLATALLLQTCLLCRTVPVFMKSSVLSPELLGIPFRHSKPDGTWVQCPGTTFHPPRHTSSAEDTCPSTQTVSDIWSFCY